MSRYFRRGKTRVFFCPTIANLAAPDISSEVETGTELTGQIAAMDGWTFESSRIPTPNLADVQTPQIAGEDTVGSPTITFYDDDASTTIATALAKGTDGFIVIAPIGLTATKKSRVFPVESAGPNDEYTVANEAARYIVGFAITDAPNLSGAFVA